MSHQRLGVTPTFSAMAEAYDSGSDETCSPERRRQGVQPPQRSCLARLELLKRQLEVCCPGIGVDGWAPCRDVHAASYVGVGDGCPHWKGICHGHEHENKEPKCVNQLDPC